MTVNELATVVMGQLSWTNMCLVGVTIFSIVAVIYLVHKVRKLQEVIDWLVEDERFS